MLHVDLKTHGYRLSRMDRDRFEHAVAHLDKLTATYPTPRLHATVERFGHSDECRVRMVLMLSRRRLIASDRAPAAATAVQRCGDTLAKLVELAKAGVHRNHGERAVRRAKEEAAAFDMTRAREAIRLGDFERFEDSLGEVPEMLEAEIARRLKFHPEADTLVGDGLLIQDLVAAVLVRAFETFEVRPENVPFREWILSLVDPAIDALVKERVVEVDEDRAKAEDKPIPRRSDFVA